MGRKDVAKSPSKASKPPGRAIVHVKVGKDRQDFSIHKDLICHCSPFFKAAFTSGFEETETGVMSLPMTEVKVFELFYDWLYTQQLPWNVTNDEDALDDKIKDLAKLYIFADMTATSSLQNHCIDAVDAVLEVTKHFPTQILPYIWQNTIESSLLRRYFIDSLVWTYDCSELEKAPHDFPKELCMEVVRAMGELLDKYQQSEITESVPPFWDKMSKYHVDEREVLRLEIRCLGKR